MQRGPASAIRKSALVRLRGAGWKSVGEPSFDFVVVNDFLTESIRTRLRSPVHFDAHGVLLSTSFLERCDCFLSHGFSDGGLFDLLVDRHLAQNRVVFLQLDAVGSVLAVLRRYVTRSSGHARFLVLGALEDDLYAVAFLRHGPGKWRAKIGISPSNSTCG